MSDKTQGTVTIGAWGGKGGRTWSFIEGTNIRITEVSIGNDYYGVTSLTFTYTDTATGKIDKSDTYGGGGGTSKTVLFKHSGEHLTKIEGTITNGSNEPVVIQSLTFYTNLDDYGPYGNIDGTKFTIPVKNGEIVGFFGHAGNYIDNIGFYVKPSN